MDPLEDFGGGFTFKKSFSRYICFGLLVIFSHGFYKYTCFTFQSLSLGS